jgi:hypothetical protein
MYSFDEKGILSGVPATARSRVILTSDDLLHYGGYKYVFP